MKGTIVGLILKDIKKWWKMYPIIVRITLLIVKMKKDNKMAHGEIEKFHFAPDVKLNLKLGEEVTDKVVEHNRLYKYIWASLGKGYFKLIYKNYA